MSSLVNISFYANNIFLTSVPYSRYLFYNCFSIWTPGLEASQPSTHHLGRGVCDSHYAAGLFSTQKLFSFLLPLECSYLGKPGFQNQHFEEPLTLSIGAPQAEPVLSGKRGASSHRSVFCTVGKFTFIATAGDLPELGASGFGNLFP